MNTETPLWDALVAELGDPFADNDEAPSADGAGGQLAPDTTPWQSGASPTKDMDAVPRRVNRDTANPQETATAETEETP